MNAINGFRYEVAFVLGVVTLWFASPSFGVDSTWTAGGGDGKWNTAGNWNNGVPKVAGDKATIAIGNTNVTLDAAQGINPVLDQFTLDGTTSTFLRITGVTFTVNGPADIKSGRVVLRDMTWNGTGTLTNTIPSSVGTLTIHETVTINSSFDQKGPLEIVTGIGASLPTTLKVAKDFTNSGRIRFSQTSGGGHTGVILSVGPDNQHGNLTNTGRIEFDNTGLGSIILAKGILNSGVINVANNNTATIGSNIDSTAQIINRGFVTILKKAKLSYKTEFRNQTDGVVEGSGTFESQSGAPYTPEGGKIAPGIKHIPAQSPRFNSSFDVTVDPEELGILTFDGGYAQDPLGTLEIQIGGTTIDSITGDTEYDRLDVLNGPALLDGSLDVSLVNGFIPNPTDTFDVLVGDGSLVGSFANALGSSLSTLTTADGIWTVEYVRNIGSPSVVRLSIFIAVPEPAAIGLTVFAIGVLFGRRCARWAT